MPLSSPRVRVLTLLLLAQAAAFYGLSRTESPPLSSPLADFPVEVGGWRMVRENVVEQEIRDVLRADDLLNRTYGRADVNLPAHLFVAYFRSQRTGQAPHSPKNCLPGSGWVPTVSDTIPIAIEGLAAPIQVNRYVVAKGEQQSVTIYWYQSRDRVVASEYTAKFFVVADALRHNRTDTALVRVIVPVAAGGVEAATGIATQFVQVSFQPLRSLLPR